MNFTKAGQIFRNFNLPALACFSSAVRRFSSSRDKWLGSSISCTCSGKIFYKNMKKYILKFKILITTAHPKKIFMYLGQDIQLSLERTGFLKYYLGNYNNISNEKLR